MIKIFKTIAFALLAATFFFGSPAKAQECVGQSWAQAEASLEEAKAEVRALTEKETENLYRKAGKPDMVMEGSVVYLGTLAGLAQFYIVSGVGCLVISSPVITVDYANEIMAD